MINKPDSNKARLTRHRRVRGKVFGTPERPRLNVFRSAKHIYAQLIDDVNGVTITEVVFDRGGYIYHGRVAELAAGARESGLKF